MVGWRREGLLTVGLIWFCDVQPPIQTAAVAVLAARTRTSSFLMMIMIMIEIAPLGRISRDDDDTRYSVGCYFVSTSSEPDDDVNAGY